MNETMTIAEDQTVSKRGTVRLTMAQAVVRHLSGLRTRIEGPGGVRAFRYSGECLRFLATAMWRLLGRPFINTGIDCPPTARTMSKPWRMPHRLRESELSAQDDGLLDFHRTGATNLVTSAALAHVNRLPVLFLPGDIFISRDPDPVLQQVESSGDGTVSANDCFRPVSRYFGSDYSPSQLLTALPRAVLTLTDPALCGPVTLALPQDVQADAFDYPVEFFETPVVEFGQCRPTRAIWRGQRAQS